MAMPASNKYTPEHAQINQAVSTAIARIHRSYYGKEPAQVITHADENTVVCLVVEPFSNYEKHLLGDSGSACDVWETFQESMADCFKHVVGESTGRMVIAFTSYAYTDPDLVLELFKLDGANSRYPYRAHG
jgi:uncharacterized protein YbcI